MRIFRLLVILLAIGGCSTKTLTVHHILPVDFSGIYVIQKGREDSGGYKVDSTGHIFAIPQSGILTVTPDVFENYCILSCSKNIMLTASFSDGKAIPMFSPISQPADSESEKSLLLGLLGGRDRIWFVVGTYEQLKKFSEQFWLGMNQDMDRYLQELERYLPPNTPFQADEQAGKN
jgi:hypothetical protein